MERRQQNIYEHLSRMRLFIDANRRALGDVATMWAKQDLEVRLSEIERAAAAQAGSRERVRRAVTEQRAAMQALLKNYLRPIAVIASHRLADSREYRLFSFPETHASTSSLLKQVSSMRAAIVRHHETFARYGFGGDLNARLAAAASRLQVAAAEHRSAHRQQVRATRLLRAAVRRTGRIRRLLDMVVQRQLVSSPELLSRWQEVVNAPRGSQP